MTGEEKKVPKFAWTSTVLSSNIHAISAPMLLWDAVRVLLLMLDQLKDPNALLISYGLPAGNR
jgi:hypothetical protein